jgi:MFS family permease
MALGKSVGWVLAALWIAEITAAFETAMLYAAVGQLMKAFGDAVKVGWLITAYLLVGAGAAAVVARLGDMYGRRRLTLILLGITVFASLLSASTSSFALILVGRSLQGLAAAMLPLCFGLVRENIPPAHRSVAVGIVMSGASAGTALGLVAGGAIVDHFGWHAIFLVSALMAAVSWVLIRLLVPVSPVNRDPHAPVDIGSVFLFVPAVVALLLAISNAKTWGWASPQVLGLLVVAALLVAVWIRRSLRHPAPLIDVRLFANRSVAIANISYALLALGGLQVAMVFSLLLQAPRWTGPGLGVSAALAGLIQLPGSMIGVLVGPIAGLAMRRFGSRAVMILGGTVAALGWAAACVGHGSTTIILLLVLVIASGTFLIYTAGPNVVMDNVPQERTSEATGMLAVIRSIAMGIGAQLVAILLATSTVGNGGAKYPDAGAYLLTFVVITGLCVLAAIAASMLPPTKRRDGA